MTKRFVNAFYRFVFNRLNVYQKQAFHNTSHNVIVCISYLCARMQVYRGCTFHYDRLYYLAGIFAVLPPLAIIDTWEQQALKIQDNRTNLSLWHSYFGVCQNLN